MMKVKICIWIRLDFEWEAGSCTAHAGVRGRQAVADSLSLPHSHFLFSLNPIHLPSLSHFLPLLTPGYLIVRNPNWIPQVKGSAQGQRAELAHHVIIRQVQGGGSSLQQVIKRTSVFSDDQAVLGERWEHRLQDLLTVTGLCGQSVFLGAGLSQPSVHLIQELILCSLWREDENWVARKQPLLLGHSQVSKPLFPGSFPL